MTPDLSRVLKASEIGAAPRAVAVETTPAERAALAERFGLIALDALSAETAVRREAAGIRLTGRLHAVATQACVLSGESVPATINTPIDLLFAEEQPPASADAEVELSETDCDIVAYDGQAVDVGEAVAQSFGLALDPFPRATGAAVDEAREHLTTEDEAIAARSPFAALKGK